MSRSPGDHLAPASTIDRRVLIRRAAAVGVAAWTAPAVITSLATPAGALTPGGCLLYVVELDRAGNSSNASATIVADASCATTVGGIAARCSNFTRVGSNGASPVGTVTLTSSYSASTAAFSFTFSISAAACEIVGSATTNGTSSTTPCASTISLTAASGSTLTLSVPSANVINSRAWAYVAVSCT